MREPVAIRIRSASKLRVAGPDRVRVDERRLLAVRGDSRRARDRRPTAPAASARVLPRLDPRQVDASPGRPRSRACPRAVDVVERARPRRGTPWSACTRRSGSCRPSACARRARRARRARARPCVARVARRRAGADHDQVETVQHGDLVSSSESRSLQSRVAGSRVGRTRRQLVEALRAGDEDGVPRAHARCTTRRSCAWPACTSRRRLLAEEVVAGDVARRARGPRPLRGPLLAQDVDLPHPHEPREDARRCASGGTLPFSALEPERIQSRRSTPTASTARTTPAGPALGRAAGALAGGAAARRARRGR